MTDGTGRAAADQFFAGLGFPADEFQRKAVDAVSEGRSVVVTAPTGAGKTLIADGAIAIALAAGRRAFYTTPIKALSNQKYADLSDEHDSVGLLTGDRSVNGGGDVVVMTTEVFRNMIYAEDDRLDQVGVVVLDEVHYLADASRGSVWEEVIIHAPAHIQFVCLSATVANAEEFTAWLRERRGPCDLVIESKRPVPLEPQYMMTDLWNAKEVQLFDMFANNRPNRRVQSLLAARTGRRKRFATPRRSEYVELLAKRNMLPAIVFIFSRAGCESAAHQIAGSHLGLTTSDERVAIRRLAMAATDHLAPEDLSVLGFDRWLADLERGVGAHHAGLIPAFKETVEQLFEAGLVKVVCATETLALGINMPARSVVIESLTKFNGESHEMLTASEYSQLTGRAGRRGIDDVGYGITLYSKFVRFDRMAELAGKGASRLDSSFRPTYNMAVNLVANYAQDDAERLLEASFAQFQKSAQMASRADRIADLTRDTEHARYLAKCDLGDIWEYRRLVDELANNAATDLDLSVGDVFEVTGGGRQGRYLLISKRPEPNPEVIALSAAGKLRSMTSRELANARWLGQLQFAGAFRPNDRKFQQKAIAQIRSFNPSEARPVAQVDHPVLACPDLEDHLRAAHTVVKNERKLAKSAGVSSGALVGEFRSILGVLTKRGYVDGWKLTESGERLRRVYGNRDLLISEAIRVGLFDNLASADLAAAVSACVYESRASDEMIPVPLALDEFAANLSALHAGLAVEEDAQGVRLSPQPEFSFMEASYHWAQGLDLDEILDGLTMQPGDFVRQIRQLMDQLRQIREAAPHLRSVVDESLTRIGRGVVAAGDGS